ncbi:FecR family protein [Acinetobacter puyangensis]|uniref:FecR family protein n=1 Tax=Acinetobacter puyangensis TaxID=1096779 RepID=UPI003A4DA773
MTDELKSNPEQLDPVMLQAIDWMVLLESGLATEQNQQDFQQWLHENPLHQQAWQNLQHDIDRPFQQLQQQSLEANLPVQAMTKTVLQAKKRHTKRMLKGGTSFVIIAVLGTVLWLQQTRPLSFIQADYYTQTAEQKEIALKDGSKITLAAYSAIKVDYNAQGRNIYLLDGTLIADVKADPTRPFVIHTEQAQMEALGTEFMVQKHKNYSDLAVLQHTVKASNIHQSKVVEQGQVVRVDQDQIHDVNIAANQLASWKDGVLQVEDMPLSEFITLIKPYHNGPIYLSEQAKTIRVYGVFYLNDTDKILQILQSTQPIKVYKKLGLVYINAKS